MPEQSKYDIQRQYDVERVTSSDKCEAIAKKKGKKLIKIVEISSGSNDVLNFGCCFEKE